MQRIWRDVVDAANRYIQETEPFKLAKTDLEACRAVLVNLAEWLRVAAILIKPFLPRTAETFYRAFNFEETHALGPGRLRRRPDAARGPRTTSHRPSVRGQARAAVPQDRNSQGLSDQPGGRSDEHRDGRPRAMERDDVADPPITYVCPELAGISMTPEEFDAVEDAEEGYRYELINGVLIVSPPPLEQERDPNEELGYLLRRYREDHPQGSAVDKTLSEQTVRCGRQRRRADRVIWAGLGRMPNPRTDFPTIIVEFVSATKRDRRRDYVEKKRQYLNAGVREYWIVDRFRRTLAVIRNRPDGVEEQVVIKADEVYRTPLLSGFELPLARLLKVADDWSEPHRKTPDFGAAIVPRLV